MYVQNGPAGLASVAADAAAAAARTDAAILPAACFHGSLPEGPLTRAALERAVSADEELVTTKATAAELTNLLNQVLILNSDWFPHISGFAVRADHTLRKDGNPAGLVSALLSEDDGSELPADETMTVVTTRTFAESGPWFTRACRDTAWSLNDALTDFLNTASPAEIDESASSERISIAADLIDTNLVLQELALPIPAPVRVNLTEPNIIPDSVLYFLSGQDRQLEAKIWDVEMPYMLSFAGAGLPRGEGNVDTSVRVTQTIPASRKTANTFDSNTIFVDLRHNSSIPAGTQITLDLGGIYPAGTLLYVYYYDENGDIIPTDTVPEVSSEGTVTFSVSGEMTYVVNALELNHTSTFVTPAAGHPFTGGIVAILAAFTLWVVLFLVRKHKSISKHRKEHIS